MTEVESRTLYELNPMEVRILACLMEKELTTPDQYPLTENAIKLACNQKTNRQPVMNLATAEIGRVLRDLQEQEWISVDRGSRADRYTQRVRSRLKIDKAQQAILCMILLRGPQTLAELKARTERMVNSVEQLTEALSRLLEGEKPFVEKMERQSGQREERYCQWIFPQEFTVTKDADSLPLATGYEERIVMLEEMVKLLESRIAALEVLLE